MKFDAVEARGLRAPRGGGEQRRQRLRQVANMRQFHVRHALAITLHEGFVLARRKRLLPAGLAELKQARAHLRFAPLSDRAPVSVGHPQEALEKLRGLGTATDGQKIDELNEQPRLAAARLPARRQRAVSASRYNGRRRCGAAARSGCRECRSPPRRSRLAGRAPAARTRRRRHRRTKPSSVARQAPSREPRCVARG